MAIDTKQMNSTDKLDKIIELLTALSKQSQTIVTDVLDKDKTHTIISDSTTEDATRFYNRYFPDFTVRLSNGKEILCNIKEFYSKPNFSRDYLCASISSGNDKTIQIPSTEHGRTITLYAVLNLPEGVTDCNIEARFPINLYISQFTVLNSTGTYSNTKKNAVLTFPEKDTNVPGLRSIEIVNNKNYSSASISEVTRVGSDNITKISLPYGATKIGDVILSKTIPIDSIDDCCWGGKFVTINSIETSMIRNLGYAFRNCAALQSIAEPLDLSSATNINRMFDGCTSLIDGGIHFKNVPKNLDFSLIGCGTSKYVIDNYKD